MPYEYRKMTLREREAVVETRRQRGYPLHAPPHPYREAGTFLITAANFEHAPVMADPERRTEFEKVLLDGFQEIEAEIIGWIILPSHYHILSTVTSLDLVSNLIQHIHGSTSYQWNKQDGLSGKRKVWFKYSDKLMRNEAHLHCSLNYIHYNAVKHGYVEDAYEWPWSSLSMYVDNMGKAWLKEVWKKFTPAPDFGKDWDL